MEKMKSMLLSMKIHELKKKRVMHQETLHKIQQEAQRSMFEQTGHRALETEDLHGSHLKKIKILARTIALMKVNVKNLPIVSSVSSSKRFILNSPRNSLRILKYSHVDGDPPDFPIASFSFLQMQKIL